MGNIKFTPVKLIDFVCALIGFILILSFENSSAETASVNWYADHYNDSVSIGLNKTGISGNPAYTGLRNDEKKHSQQEKMSGSGGNSILKLFFKEEKIEQMRSDLIKYGNDHLPLNIRSTYHALVEISFEHSLVFIFTGLILFFVINLLFVYLFLNFTIQRKNQKSKFERVFSKLYEEVLLSYLFHQITWETALVKLKGKDRKNNRKVLITILLNFKMNFKGETEQFVQDIYLRLNLQQDSLKLANSLNSFKKVQGLMELTHLYPEGARDLVQKLINDHSNVVRAEAQTAFIRLNQETPFDFFHSLQKPFSKWTQLSAFNLIRLHQLPVPSFAQFLEFKNSFIQEFSLKMITYFQQLENVPGILRMLDNKKDSTRFLAYKAINDLRLYDSRELMKKKYSGETERNRLEIIKAFRNIGNADDFHFLFEVIKQDTISIKTEACRSMYYMSAESRDELLKNGERLDPKIELLVAHVTDYRN